MEKRTLGRTGLEISRLGVGLAEIGFNRLDAAEAGRVLNLALDSGITFLDTAACYDISEELIGQTVAHRRDEYVLATKCGHVTGGYTGEAWTAQTVTDSIDRSLRRLQTDHLDLVQLHSCGVDVLEKGEVIEALKAAQQAGKTRFIGYSGDNEPAAWAVQSGHFDTLQTSFNLTDQRARLNLFAPAKAQNMGVIVKRPIANGAWGAASSPSDYADQYFARAQAMMKAGPIDAAPENRILAALGFTLSHPEVDTAIVGTRNPDHMRANIEMVENQLPISPAVVNELHRRFEALDDDWRQLT